MPKDDYASVMAEREIAKQHFQEAISRGDTELAKLHYARVTLLFAELMLIRPHPRAAEVLESSLEVLKSKEWGRDAH